MVLALLGAHLLGEVRGQQAARLPEGFALILLNPMQSAESLPPERFLRATAAWVDGATEQIAAWDVRAVLSTVADTAGDGLLKQILIQLPAGYDLLFGQPQPIRPSPSGLHTPAGTSTTTPPLRRAGRACSP